jgi:hypothetical protein
MPSSRVTSEIRRLQVPAQVGFTIVAASGQSANLTEWQNSSGTVLSSISSAGLASFPNVAVTATTIPTNGIYLPAANTLGFATNSAVRLQISSTGGIGIGNSALSNVIVRTGRNTTGSTSSYAFYTDTQIQSDVTSGAYIYTTSVSTQAAAFTLSNLYHYSAFQGSFGASSAVTNQYGIFIDSSLINATNNFGIASNIALGSNRWNAYMVGTAANYFAGQTTVGSTSLTLGSGSVAQQFGVVSAAATNIGMVIRGAASQSGDLTQWQNSAGTALGSFDAYGQMTYAQQTIIQTNAGAIVSRIRGATSQTADLTQWQNSSGTVLSRVSSAGAITSAAATAGIGYGTGAGATATQGAGSGKSTGVTLNNVTGQITMNNATLNASTTVSFTLTNSAIAATDMVLVQHISAGTLGAYTCTAAPAAGSATVYVRNITAGNLGEAIVIQFLIIKAVTA